MREILFRGKSVDHGEWIEGQYVRDISRENVNSEDLRKFAHKIQPLHYVQAYMFPVDPATVCQYTEKEDCNNKQIFEEDFVKINDEWNGRVIWRNDVTAFCVMPDDDIDRETYCLGYYVEEGYKVEVIGNYFDNPELISDSE